jgi:hypothetical protein
MNFQQMFERQKRYFATGATRSPGVAGRAARPDGTAGWRKRVSSPASGGDGLQDSKSSRKESIR